MSEYSLTYAFGTKAELIDAAAAQAFERFLAFVRILTFSGSHPMSSLEIR